MSQQPCLPLPKRKERQRLAALSSKFTESRISGNLPISSLENMDAMAFLSAAHAEAQSLPEINVSTTAATSSNRENKNTKNNNGYKHHDYVEGTHVSLSLLLSSKTDIPPCPSLTLLPQNGDITEWIDGTLDNFSRLRLYLQSCQNMKQPAASSNKNDNRVPVPPMREAASWHEFCLGKSEAEGNAGGYFDDDESFHSEGGMDEDDEGDDDDVVVALWRSQVPSEGHPPKTKLLLQMDQVMTRRVLMHHVDFVCEGWELTEKRLSWIYALLARIEKPLHRDDNALLRRLLRECCLRRIDMEGKGRALACVNVVITVVGIYFEQGMHVMEVNS